MKYWKKYSKEKLIKRIDTALNANVNFQTSKALGYPVSRLDENVFNIAIKGTIDDGQEIVKGAFNDIDFKNKYMEIFYITHAFSAYALSGILIASFCLFIGITLVAKKRPLLISSRFFCAAIALAILPDFIGNSIIMGPSEPGGFPFMTWANWFMFICVLAVFWIQAKGYLLIGIHDESFRKALHFSLNKKKSFSWLSDC